MIGGYPDPVLGIPASRRARWQLSYLDRLLTRDALDVDTDGVLRNGDILGRMIETFVLAQLRAELPLYDHPPRLYHLRQEGGARKIDLIAELGVRRVIGLEITARSARSGSERFSCASPHTALTGG